MQAGKIKLADIFQDSVTLIVPVYQRNYDWHVEQCQRLFDDILKWVETSDEHFLGAIVCQDKNLGGMFNEHIIVDGQQRISSIIIFAKALYDSTDDEETKKQIQNRFIKPSTPNPKYQFKLLPAEYDREIFEKLMNGENLNDAEQKFKMYEAYKFFKDAINKSNCEVSKLHEAIYHLQAVRILLENEKPQEIFESLNSTGKDLNETDLIRNFLLMDLDPVAQENFYKKYWLPMEKLLADAETVEKFMIQYLVSRKKSNKTMKGGKNIQISKYALYEPFKKYFAQNYSGAKVEQVEKFLADMYHNVKFYSRLIFDANTNFENLSALEKKFYELVYILDASSSPIILMDLNRMYEQKLFDEKTFAEMVDALISLMFRAKVCRRTGVDTAQNAGNILWRFAEKKSFDTDSFWESMASGNGKYIFPDNETFKQALLSGELFLTLKADTCKYLLYKLEKKFGDSSDLPNYKNTYVDFVMPKKLNKNWKDYLQLKNDLNNHEIYYNSLGNLILTADDRKNISAFSEKRVNFATSEFSFTRLIKDNSDWTSRQIQRRANNLAERALKIWAFPEKYNRPADSNENIFNLDSDFRIFTGTELATVSILGKEYQINRYIDFLRQISKVFYSLDKNIFMQSLTTDRLKKIFSASPEKLVSPFEIDKNFYLGAGIDTKTCLNFANTIVENFDSIGGTNFKDEIWFTLKK